MQGKLVFSQSLSTFLSTKRRSIIGLLVELKIAGGSNCKLPPQDLLGQRKVRGSVSGNLDWIGFVLRAFVPCGYGVGAVRHILDLEFARLVCLREIGSWRNDHVRRHLRVNVAEQRDHARIIKLEGLLLSLGPCPQVVSQLLVAADRDPEDVVRYAVAVEKIN